MKIIYFLLLFQLPLQASNADFFKELTPSEQGDIHYMIMTLATNSSFQLAFKQGNLQKAGDRTAHINPFLFFAFVLTDQQLRHSIKKINGMIWHRFRDGMANSFASEARENAIDEVVLQQFSQITGVQRNRLDPLVMNRNWKALLELIKQG